MTSLTRSEAPTGPRPVVLDSSIGVKWIRKETGTDAAESILLAHRREDVLIAVPALFLHEVMSVAIRERGPGGAAEVWKYLEHARLMVADLDSTLASETLSQCQVLGCSFYDGLAPALARLLAAPLYSADARAHRGFPDVVLIGE